MKIRRILATAVAAAVTTPVVFLSASPAFADTKPSAPAQTQNQKPTIEQLKLAVTKAQEVYDAAVVAFDASQKAIDALDKADHPLQVALAEAKKAAETAAADKTAADKAVVDAQAKLDAATTDEEKAAAQTALDEAKTKAEAAATAKTTADGNVTKASKAVEDERAGLLTKTGEAKTAKENALKALKAAEKALAEAEEEEPGDECKDVSKTLTLDLTGPKKVTAGTSADFSLKFGNDTGMQLDEVSAFASAFSETDEESDPYLDLKWSFGGSEWESLDEDFGIISVGAMKPGAKADVKLRLTVDAKAPAGRAAVISAGGYDNNDGSCGYGEEADVFEFAIEAKKGTKPSTGSDGGSTGGGNTDTTEQGGTSTTPVNGGTTGSTTGNLAETGSDSAVPQIAMAGGAAVVLGAGAMFFVRRRKAGVDA